MIKKYVPWILAIILFVSLAAGLFYQQRSAKAAITNIVLAEKLRISKSETAYIRVKYKLLGDVSTIRVLEWQGIAENAEANEKKIQTKSANEIRAIRNQKGELKDKYDILEKAGVKLADKVEALKLVIDPLKQANAELGIRDLIRLANIEELEDKLTECQDLLKISIANTDSILKKGWLWKLFGNIKIGPALLMGIDGKPHFGIGALWAIN